MSAVTDTIRKLLAIAEDPSASPHEREVAANRAATLMARHAITSLDLNTAHTGSPPPASSSPEAPQHPPSPRDSG